LIFQVASHRRRPLHFAVRSFAVNSDHLWLLNYIDPGIGSIILQVLFAGLLSAGLMFRRYLVAPFKSLFRKSSKPDDASRGNSN
jgi:hypothetical protein